ncbi:hypothetical protein FRC08_008479 [Ceratobasidium sp. 394]|nr:hypothetical protein FRC08_008479 [Ceratobasidium sp. 394]
MSLIDKIISAAPPGSNPYAFAAGYFETLIPAKPEWFFTCLMIIGILAPINLLSTVVSTVIMWRQSRLGKTSFWFLKKQYGHPSGIAYIVPNALSMFLLWNMIFMSLLNAHIWVNYFAFRTMKLPILSRLYFWYGFVFAWDAIGMWTSAFGTLYVTLLPKLFVIGPDCPKLKRFGLHPITLNTLCFFTPFGFAIAQTVTAVYASNAWSDCVHTQYKLVAVLKKLASPETESTGNQASLLAQATELGNLFLIQGPLSQSTFIRTAQVCLAWYLLSILLLIPTCIWLLSTIRKSMQLQERPAMSNRLSVAELEKRPEIPSQSTSSSDANKSTSLVQADDSANTTSSNISLLRLKRAYYTVALQCVATVFCMSCTVGMRFWLTFDLNRIASTPRLNAFGTLCCVWVYTIVGSLVNILVLLRACQTFRAPTPVSSNTATSKFIVRTVPTTTVDSSRSNFISEPKHIMIKTLATTDTIDESPTPQKLEPSESHEQVSEADMDSKPRSVRALSDD